MRTITKCLAAGAAIAALASAAPAAAQFFPGYGAPGYGYPGYGYPGYGYPGYGYGAGGVIGSIINSVTGRGYGGYGYNTPGGGRVAASQCTVAVQQRLGGYGYAYGGGAGRVLSINSVEIRGNGGYTVRGLASAAGYGGGRTPFVCHTDPRGLVMNVDFNTGYYGNGYGNPYYGSDTNNPYSVYGYSRY